MTVNRTIKAKYGIQLNYPNCGSPLLTEGRMPMDNYAEN